MTDFVVVVATAAMLAAPAPAAPDAAPSVPVDAPTVGFRAHPDAASCEQATAALVAPAGKRLVCVPVEPMAEGMASAY